MKEKKGILIIAQGHQRYINMAKNVAMSYKLTNKTIPIALVTDSTDPQLKDLYDYIVPINPEWGKGLIQKIYMDQYSIFEETLYIDVDCLIIRNIDFLWQLFENSNVSVIGRKVLEGSLFGMSVQEARQKLKLDYLITFNGGVYYFKNTDKSKNIFDKARELVDMYDKLGIARHRGQINEEPLMSLAISFGNEEPVDDNKKGMYTPVGQKGVFKMDALKGYCQFYKNGIKVEPAIMHFGGGYPEAFHYKREVLKIKLVYTYKLPPALVSFLINFIFNPSYIIYVFGYRLLKSLVKRNKFKITPLMPMFRFE